MQVNFSVVSEDLARTYGDAECIVNVERDRRYSFRDYHLLTDRVVEQIILSVRFLAAAPLVVLNLWRASNGPFLEMARSMVNYTMKYQGKVPVGRRAK